MLLSRNSKILVSVLDWGLGHASRTSAVVRRLLERGCTVVLAGSGNSLALLSADFPGLEVVSLPSFSPKLSASSSQWLSIGLQVPQFLLSVWREHRAVDAIVKQYNIDAIVSDNRYGLFSSLCPSFVITHQLNVRIATHAPRWCSRFVSRVLGLFLRRFDAVLVPDRRIGDLSGELSSPVPGSMRAHCIGVPSRLTYVEPTHPGDPIEWLGVVSGPEPQRSMMVTALLRRFSSLSGRRVIVCGQPSANKECQTDEGVEIISYADAPRLKGLLLSAKHIVCRSGYSTILDIAALRLNGVELIPTPGQAEQEYLANLHKRLHF